MNEFLIVKYFLSETYGLSKKILNRVNPSLPSVAWTNLFAIQERENCAADQLVAPDPASLQPIANDNPTACDSRVSF